MLDYSVGRRREHSLTKLRTAPEVVYRLSHLVEYISIGYVEEMEQAIARVEALPAAALPKNPSDLDTVILLRGYVTPSYWAELFRLKAAADVAPLMAMVQAAGGRPVLNRALSIVRSEMPRVEKELQTMASLTLFYHDRESIAEHVHPDDENFIRGMLYGQCCNSLYFGEAVMLRVIEFFSR